MPGLGRAGLWGVQGESGAYSTGTSGLRGAGRSGGGRARLLPCSPQSVLLSEEREL